MMRFFQKSSGIDRDPTESRLRGIERKLNILMALVAGLLIVESLAFFSSITSMLIPTPTTIALIALVAIGAGYVFRKQIPRLFRRLFLPATEPQSVQPDKSIPEFDDATNR